MDLRSQMIRDIRSVYGFGDEIVLSVMKKVPRHKLAYVPKESGYLDNPISIGYGQTVSQPYTVAYMTHLLISSKKQITSEKIREWKVLEIGTGSGYQTAVLAELVSRVHTIEIIEELAKKANNRLKKLGYKNIYFKVGSGEFGWEEYSPYDGIIITAALKKDIPKDLIKQLKIGGVIVAPIGSKDHQIMTRFTKVDEGKFEKEKFERFVFVPFVKRKPVR